MHSAQRNYIYSAQRNYVPSAQRNDGVQCTNNGVSAAPSGTLNLKRKTTPPGPSHNQKRLRANTQGEATAKTYSTSVDDVNKSVEENDECDLTELDNDSTSPGPVQEIFGLGSDRSQMQTDWTGLGPDRFLTVSRVRVYFPIY